MEKLNTQEFDSVIANGVTLVDFFADWCGPCKMLSPILEELDNEYPSIKFCKINVDENMELADRFTIMSIPMVFIFKDGKILAKMTGYQNKDGVKNFIEKALKEE